MVGKIDELNNDFEGWFVDDVVIRSVVDAAAADATLSGTTRGVPVGAAIGDANGDGFDDFAVIESDPSGDTARLYYGRSMLSGLAPDRSVPLPAGFSEASILAVGNVNGDRMERVIHAHAETDALDPEDVRRMYAIGTSMQCYVDPEEIADLITFLCSDYGRHISGQIVAVDGNTETLYPRN